MPIAIADFGGPTGADIASVLRSDLDSRGLFIVHDPKSLTSKHYDVHLTPKFADWRAINTEAFVIGGCAKSKNILKVEFSLWDIYGESQTLGLEYSSTDENWRRIAHKIAEAIYKRLTGNSGMFDLSLIHI